MKMRLIQAYKVIYGDHRYLLVLELQFLFFKWKASFYADPSDVFGQWDWYHACGRAPVCRFDTLQTLDIMLQRALTLNNRHPIGSDIR